MKGRRDVRVEEEVVGSGKERGKREKLMMLEGDNVMLRYKVKIICIR